MDKSAQKVAPTRRLEVRPNHMSKDSGFLLVAVVERPEGGRVETLLHLEPIHDHELAKLVAETTARGIEQATGVMYAY